MQDTPNVTSALYFPLPGKCSLHYTFLSSLMLCTQNCPLL